MSRKEAIGFIALLVGFAGFSVGSLEFASYDQSPGRLADECYALVHDGRSTADLWVTGAVPEQLSGCERPTFATASSTRGVVIACADGRRWLVSVEGVWCPRLGEAVEIRGGGL